MEATGMDKISKLYEALEYFRKVIGANDRECTIQKATIFLTVALNEGITHDGVQEIQKFHQGTISRNLKELGSFKAKTPEGDWEDKGSGLVVSEPYEYNRRKYAVFLSPKGKKVLNKLKGIID